MLSREELQLIEDYCSEQHVSLEQAFVDLSVPRHQYFSARRKYRREDSFPLSPVDSPAEGGDFIRLSPSSPSPSDELTLELHLPSGAALRLHGRMNADILRDVIMTAGHVQP